MPADIVDIPGTPLTPETLALLPDEAPPAPWTVHGRAIAWWKRPDAHARATLAETLPEAITDGATPILVIGGMVSYHETPVGPYNEVLGIVVLRRGTELFGHMPFIAVDAPASVVGGRVNWSLPKTLAEFDGEPRSGSTMTAIGEDWELRATARARAIALPWLLPPVYNTVQVAGDGSVVRMRGLMHGRAHLARVDVEINAAPSIAGWYPSGKFVGLTGSLNAGVPAPR